MVLLDTCTVLWLAGETDALTARARKAIERSKGKLYVSAISGFEIGAKVRRKGIELPLPAREWLVAVMEHHGLLEEPISTLIALTATELPPIHRDPFDRLIVATALERNYQIVTPDPQIAAYPDVETIW